MFFYLSLIDEPENRSKFEFLYRKYEDRVFRWAKYYVNDDYVAEDITQLVWIGIAQNIAYIKTDDEFLTLSYLKQSVKNAAVDYWRSEKAKPSTVCFEDVEEYVFENDPTSDLESEEGYREIVRQICRMPDAYRDVLILRYLHDLPLKQIAAVLRRNPQTVKTQLKRGTKKLREILKGGRTE